MEDDNKPKLTFEELVEMEKDAYFVHADGSVFTIDDKYIFDLKAAKYISNKMMEGFREQLKNGDKKTKKHVKEVLLNFAMYPLRYH